MKGRLISTSAANDRSLFARSAASLISGRHIYPGEVDIVLGPEFGNKPIGDPLVKISRPGRYRSVRQDVKTPAADFEAGDIEGPAAKVIKTTRPFFPG